MWAASLREIKKRIRPLFRQERGATNAGLFLEGLLGDEQRKTGWMRAEAAGDPGPWRQQAILGRMDWDADALRDIWLTHRSGDNKQRCLTRCWSAVAHAPPRLVPRRMTGVSPRRDGSARNRLRS